MSTIVFAIILGAVVGMCVSAIVSAIVSIIVSTILARDCKPHGYSEVSAAANVAPDDVPWSQTGEQCTNSGTRTNRKPLPGRTTCEGGGSCGSKPTRPSGISCDCRKLRTRTKWVAWIYTYIRRITDVRVGILRGCTTWGGVQDNCDCVNLAVTSEISGIPLCDRNLVSRKIIDGRTHRITGRRIKRGKALSSRRSRRYGTRHRRGLRETDSKTRRPTDRNPEHLVNQRLIPRLLTLTRTLIDAIQRMPSTEPMNDGTTTTVVQAPRLYTATMLRPGQPGAPFFDKVNVTDFLRHWNAECEDCGLDVTRKCERLWFYCSEDVKRTIEFFDGYRRKDWEALETELKTFFYRYDSSRTRHIHDLTALNQIMPTLATWTFPIIS